MNPTPREMEAVGAALRQAVKTSGRTYRELGAAVGVSERTIKRLASGKGDTSLARLIAICRALDLDFFELIRRAGTPAQGETYTLSDAQEQFLLENPRHYSYLLHLNDGESPNKIMRRYGLSVASNQRYLRDLEAHGLIERLPGDRCRLSHQGSLIHAGNGPIAQAQMGAGVGRIRTFLNERPKDAIGGLVTASTRLSRATALACEEKVRELITQLHRLGRRDRDLPDSELIDAEWAIGFAAPFKAFPRLAPAEFESPKPVTAARRRRAG